MTQMISWKAQNTASATAVVEAQRYWLSQVAKTLGTHLQHDSSPELIGECLRVLLSGLLQSAVSVEEACAQSKWPTGEMLIAEHNDRCLKIVALIYQHEQGKAVGEALLECLRGWLLNDQRQA